MHDNYQQQIKLHLSYDKNSPLYQDILPMVFVDKYLSNSLKILSNCKVEAETS